MTQAVKATHVASGKSSNYGVDRLDVFFFDAWGISGTSGLGPAKLCLDDFGVMTKNEKQLNWGEVAAILGASAFLAAPFLVWGSLFFVRSPCVLVGFRSTMDVARSLGHELGHTVAWLLHCDDPGDELNLMFPTGGQTAAGQDRILVSPSQAQDFRDACWMNDECK